MDHDATEAQRNGEIQAEKDKQLEAFDRAEAKKRQDQIDTRKQLEVHWDTQVCRLFPLP